MGARYIFRINRCGALQPAAAACSSCEPGYWEDVKAEHMASVTLASLSSASHHWRPFIMILTVIVVVVFVAVVLVVVFDDVIVIVVVGFVVIVVSSSSSSSSSASP